MKNEYQKQKAEAERIYKAIGDIKCPAFTDGKIHFTSEGFNHLMFTNKTARTQAAQIAKFKLVPYIKELVNKSGTIQEYDEKMQTVVKKMKKKNIQKSVVVQYWGLVAIIRGVRLKVIIRRVDNGQYQFWSVIPAWTSSHQDGYKVFSKAHGDLTQD